MFYLTYKIFSSFSRRERQILLGIFLTFLVSGFFVSLNAYYSATKEQPALGGRYLEGVIGQPTFINPLLASNSEADADLIEIIYSDLHDLIEKFEVSNDKKVWTLILKNDLRWSDGKKLTADDVVFTIEALQDPDNRSPLAPAWQGAVIEKINENEVRFTLKAPYAFFADNLKILKIAPKHIFGGIPVANLKLSAYNLEPVASGPYKFNHLTTEKDGFISEIFLTTNPYYHQKPPFIPELVFKFYRNEQNLIRDFNLKKISGFGGLNPENTTDLQIHHQLVQLYLPRYYAIFLNSSLQPAFKDKTLRQALDRAINKKKLIKEVFADYAALAEGPIPPTLAGYDKSVYENLNTPDTPNPQIPNNLELHLVVPDIHFLIKSAKLIKEDWEKLGVKLTTTVLGINDINRNIIRNREYPLLIFGNILKSSPDIYAFWHSSEKFHPGLNLSLYENGKIDKLLEQVRQELDKEKRQLALTEIQKIIRDEVPAIFLFNPTYLYVAPPELQGFDNAFLATPAHRFENIAKWHLKTRRTFEN